MGCTRNLSGFISAEGPVTPPLTDDVWSYYLLVMGRPRGLCSAPMSPSPICLFLSMYLLPEEGGGSRRKGRKRWRAQQHLNTKQSSKSQPQRKQSRHGRAALYQRCQSSGWYDPSDPWLDHFSQVWLDRPCSCLDICCLTGPKLRIFDRLIEKHPFNKSPL